MGHGVISAKKRQLLHDGISQVCAAPHIQIHDMNLDGLMRVKAFASQALDKRRLIIRGENNVAQSLVVDIYTAVQNGRTDQNLLVKSFFTAEFCPDLGVFLIGIKVRCFNFMLCFQILL